MYQAMVEERGCHMRASHPRIRGFGEVPPPRSDYLPIVTLSDRGSIVSLSSFAALRVNSAKGLWSLSPVDTMAVIICKWNI